MKKTFTRFFILIGLIVIVFVGTLFLTVSYVLDTVFKDACANDVIETLTSPDEEKIAYIFSRNCGATTSVSYMLTILDAQEELENKAGNAFRADQTFSAEWSGNEKMTIHYPSGAEIFKKKKRFQQVTLLVKETKTSKGND